MPTENGRANVAIIGSYAKALVVTTDRIPVTGETLIGTDYRQTYGGKGSDMAVQAARLGAHAEYIGVIGDDPFGHEFQGLMRSEGIGTKYLRIDGEAPTGVGFIIKDVEGSNIIVVDMGANEAFTPADIDAASQVLSQAQVALAQLEIPLETALHGLAAAKNHGATTIFNPAPAANLTDVDLSKIDVLTPNETEARVVLGLDPEDPITDEQLGEKIAELGPATVVITKGSEGAFIYSADSGIAETVPAFKIDIVDSNGAGDSFNAGLAVALAEGKTIQDAVRFASATAALSCEHWETVPSYQDRKTVESFLKGN